MSSQFKRKCAAWWNRGDYLDRKAVALLIGDGESWAMEYARHRWGFLASNVRERLVEMMESEGMCA